MKDPTQEGREWSSALMGKIHELIYDEMKTISLEDNGLTITLSSPGHVELVHSDDPDVPSGYFCSGHEFNVMISHEPVWLGDGPHQSSQKEVPESEVAAAAKAVKTWVKNSISEHEMVYHTTETP